MSLRKMISMDRIARVATITLLLTALSVAPAMAETQSYWRFDFGTAKSPVQDGYTQVTKNSAFDAEKGFGWLPGQESLRSVPPKPHANPGEITGIFDRLRPSGTALTSDFVMASFRYHPSMNHTFTVQVPAGEYEVAVLSGDARHHCGAFTLRMETGETVSHKQKSPRKFEVTKMQVNDTDGQLLIHFDTEAWWTIDGVLIYPVDQAEEVGQQESMFFDSATPIVSGS